MAEDEARLRVRTITPDDFDAIIALQRACFPSMEPWKPRHLQSMLAHFPEGQIAVEVEGEIVGSSCSLIVDHADYTDWHDYRVISDGGFIRNHDPEGDTLYGIEMQVHPAWRGRKLSRRMYEARKALCRERNLERMVIGGRIPGYGAQSELTPEDYVQAVMDKRLFDSVLTSQLANGFRLTDIVADYLPSDEDSAGYATILEWVNHDHVPAAGRRHRRAVFPVRLGVVQWPMRRVATFGDFVEQIAHHVDTASDYRCDFLLFPELFTLQLLSLLEPGRPGSSARELAGFTPRWVEHMRELAMKFNINIVGGSQFELVGDDLYNHAFLFRRDGTVERQPKIHVTPNEARWWGIQGGDKVRVFDTDRGKIAMLVCYDVEFPELVRHVVAQGARLLFVPFNTNDRHGWLRVRTCAHARCIENHLYVAIAGCVGHLPNVDNADLHYARSAVLTPCDIGFARDGIAAETGTNVEALLVQDVDLEALRRHRATGTVRNWDDRRTDLYEVRWLDQTPS